MDLAQFWKITSLALADSINPCEIAVLALVLINLLIHNPGKKYKVLTAGFAFISAVFIGYIFYGLVIVQFFSTFSEFFRLHTGIIYNTLGIAAMIIGALNIKDFFYYKKGGFATEMPVSMRPKLKKIVENITSEKGAFLIGFIVTIFLLPCTIGPYVIASGILAEQGIIKAIPWLIYYNIIFVLPMIAIVLIVYKGFATVEEVSGWKEKHIRKLHLIAGILTFIVGLALIMRWL